MSEYWKSTPRYWCKHCKTYVRDTKLERTNHDATPKHQSSIKRFLQGLHRGHEREEREKQRAKDEVNRLNGVVAGVSTSTVSAGGLAPWKQKPTISSLNSGPKQATPAERKRQLAQLAEMGVAIPEEFRGEMAMAGDWQTVSESPLLETAKAEKETRDNKAEVLNIGVHKRKYEDQDEEDKPGEVLTERVWGSTTRSYPGVSPQDEELDFLLRKTSAPGKTNEEATSCANKSEKDPEKLSASGILKHEPLSDRPPGQPFIKSEDPDETVPSSFRIPINDPAIQQEPSPEDSGIVFKKRKIKPIRNK